MIDIKRLFDRYRVEYRERGANVGRGNINLNCPLCKKTNSPDPSFHCGIFLATGDWHCLRNSRHSGHSPVFLFQLLKIPAHEYKDLVFKETDRTEKVVEKDFSLIRYFDPAEKNQEALDYLESRLFINPVETCRQFKLLTTKEGKWAGRLIIPLTVGWTARSMRDHIEPRYITESTSEGYFFYSPYRDRTSVIIQEGPIDAMRLATVSNQFDYAGMTGKKLCAPLLALLRRYQSIYFLPDNSEDVSRLEILDFTRQIRSYAPNSR